MHWISILTVLVAVAICQGQSGSSPNAAQTGNSRGTLHVVSGGNGADASGSQNGADGSVQVSAGNVPPGSFMQHSGNGQNSMQYGNTRLEGTRNDGQRHGGNVVILFSLPLFAAMMYLRD